MHFQVGNERIPVRHRTPSGPGMKVDAHEAEGRWDECRRRLAVGPESLTVEEQLRIELSWSPTLQDCSHSRLVHAQQIRDRLEVRTQRRNRANVEVAIDPSVETTADAGRKRVVHRRVAERTGNADRLKASIVFDSTFHADN